ncbi:DNA polymerase I [Lachnospiraceae bacterium NE2001]|nr:DNA polymerase I [Lachnospiraceae bacterium NE2001]
MSKLLLIDGNSIMNRGYYALPKTLTDSKGLHTNAILGFLNIFYKIYSEEQPTNIIVAFDMHAPTFRHNIYKEYKGTRKGMEPELREQFPVIKDVLSIMKVLYVEKAGYEADDIIGTYSRQAEKEGMEVSILSGDRDLLQLATDSILVRIPKTKGGQTTIENYYAKDVVAEYGVTPLEFIEMKGLMGDTSDNIPGVEGIGPKTASNIIQKYHSIEAALADIEHVKPDKARTNLDANREMALFSRDLATIKLDCELEESVSESQVGSGDIYSSDVYNVLLELGFRTLLKRFENVSAEEIKVETKIEINPVDISYPELIEKIRSYADSSVDAVSDNAAEAEKFVGFGTTLTNGSIYGAAISFNKEVYIVRGNELKNLRRDIPSNIKLSFVGLKEYIDYFGLEESDNLFDVSLGAYLIDPLVNGYNYSYIASRFLGVEIEDEKLLIGKDEITPFSLDMDNYRKMISYMAYTAAESVKPIIDKLKSMDEYSLYTDIEYPVIFVLNSMESYGVRVDSETLTEYGKQLDEKLDTLTESIYKLAGEEFNINSPKQLGVILFEKLGLKSGKKTKSGYSTSVDVLSKLRDDHPIIPEILEYRSISKLRSTYVDGLLESIRSDGRIHSKFNQTVTATGRLSSTEPNLQNIPTRTAEGREIRKSFVPAEGYTFVDADYSQIELRVMASISEDESLIEAFNSSKDIHAITASQVFGVPIEEVDSTLRRRAKAVNFGIIYGISSFGLGEDLGISRKEAKDYIDKYFATYVRVKDYLDSCVQGAKDTGVVRTMYGRLRPIPELQSSNFMQRSFGERVAMNSPIQGTAADIIKLAMIKVWHELKARNLKSRLILQIHDELLIETAPGEVEEVTELLRENMENAATLAVPLYVDVHTGSTLYDAK